MLKTTLTAIVGAMVLHTGAVAQIYVKSNGVGIGTNTPTEKLHVAGRTLMETNDGNVLTFSSPAANSWQFLAHYKGGQRYAWTGLNSGSDYSIRTETAPGNIFLLPKSGRVIIESDQDNSQVGGSVILRHGGKTGTGEAMEWAVYNMKGSYGPSLQFWAYGDFGSRMALALKDDGNIGIGTQWPEQKLHVAGTVKAYTYLADAPPHWPDYVFDSAYQMPTLPEVEQFIQQNHHLPEVPSAATVKKEGIDLSNNQAVLLRKIEELTLYVIEQNKKIQALETKMKGMEEKGK